MPSLSTLRLTGAVGLEVPAGHDGAGAHAVQTGTLVVLELEDLEPPGLLTGEAFAGRGVLGTCRYMHRYARAGDEWHWSKLRTRSRLDIADVCQCCPPVCGLRAGAKKIAGRKAAAAVAADAR